MTLSAQHIKQLKALAHNKDPVVRVGQHGVSEAVIKELQLALDHHELVKVKVAGHDRDDRHTVMDELCEKTDAVSIQRIGGVLVLYRRNPKKQIINLS